MIIRSKAPLRISFGGGGTDVPPYPEERGGVCLNTTINKYAYGTLMLTEGETTEIHSLDYDIVAKYNTDTELVYNGELDLVKAVVKSMAGEQKGLKLFLHSDAPPGSGLGSSSTMAVALIGLFKHLNRPHLTDYEVARLAYEIERIDLGIAGGEQDQYAAVFGGFNFMEFRGDTTVVNPLRIKRDTLNELEYRLLLCYTGGTRLSANIIREQVGGFVEKKKDVVDALDETKAIAIEMKDALLRGELDDFGELLHRAWLNKKNFSSKITSPVIDGMYDMALKNGAVGGKILGAGGGGYLMLFCDFDRKHVLAEKLEGMGGQIVEFGFERQGLQTWGAGD